jgi:hypothetical protein
VAARNIHHGGTEDTEKRETDIEQEEAEVAESELFITLCFLCYLLSKMFCLSFLRALRASVV